MDFREILKMNVKKNEVVLGTKDENEFLSFLFYMFS